MSTAQDSLTCAVCAVPLGNPTFVSSGNWSITSLCTVSQTPCKVHFCPCCGHLQTPAMAGIEQYYDTEYRILIDSEEEDQLYRIEAGRKVFRLDHQAATFLAKLTPAAGATVLDYGCAKGGTLKRVLERRPDLQVRLFDVSEMYLRFWRRFLSEDRWSTYRPRPEWAGTCDIITSFFALEHVADPVAMLRDIRELLRPGGTLYLIVPDTYANPADFVVSDHVNHFSPASLATLFARTGFRTVAIDAEAHDSALVAIAVRSEKALPPPERAVEVARLAGQVKDMAAFWGSYIDRVRAFEQDHAGRPVAIYGSGFYGTFLATCLADLGAVRCFIDQSPFRQDRMLLDRPIVAPEALPAEVDTVYVGLNPARAHGEIAKVACWADRRLDHFYP